MADQELKIRPYGVNRAERRQLKKLQGKNKSNDPYQYLRVKQITDGILLKMDDGLSLDEQDISFLELFRTAYIYRKKHKSLIFEHWRSQIIDRKSHSAALFECCFKAYFEIIDPIVEKESPLGRKIIDYWDDKQKKYYDSEAGELRLRQQYDSAAKVYKEHSGDFYEEEMLSFEDYKKLAKSKSIKDCGGDEKISFSIQKMCKESGVELGGKKETMDEYWERLYSDPKKLDKDVKIVLDNLPDFETYLKCIKKDMKHITEDLIDTEDKKMASTIAVSDMLKYVEIISLQTSVFNAPNL